MRRRTAAEPKKSPRRKPAGESRYHLLSEAAVGPEDYLHVELLTVPQDGQGHGIADDVAAPDRQQVAGDGNGLAVRRQDYIAGLDAGVGGAGAAG